MRKYYYHSCNVKRKVVVEDELDNGVRLYLNFGHTIGHAVEATAGYGKVMHGEAVAIGMVQISRLLKKGLMPKGITKEIFKCAKNLVCQQIINHGILRCFMEL